MIITYRGFLEAVIKAMRVYRGLVVNAHNQALSTMSKKRQLKLHFTGNNSGNLKLDHIYHILCGLLLCKYFNEETPGSRFNNEDFEHCYTLFYQRYGASSKSRTEEEHMVRSFFYHALAILKNIICRIFQKLSCLRLHTRETIVSGKKQDYFQNEEVIQECGCGVHSTCTLGQENLHKRAIHSHHFLDYDIPDNDIWMIETLVSLDGASSEEDRLQIAFLHKISNYDTDNDISIEEGDPKVHGFHFACFKQLCLEKTLENDGMVAEFSCTNGEQEVTLIIICPGSVGMEMTNSVNVIPADISVDEMDHLTLVQGNGKIRCLKIVQSNQQLIYSYVTEEDALLNFRSKFLSSHFEVSPIQMKWNSVVEFEDCYKDTYVDAHCEHMDRPTAYLYEKSRQSNCGSGDSAQVSNPVTLMKPTDIVKHKKHSSKQTAAKKGWRCFGWFARCTIKLRKCINFCKNSVKRSWSYAGAEKTSISRAAKSQRCTVLKYKLSQEIKVSILFRLHRKFEDCYVKDIYHCVNDQTTENSHPVMTQNSIHTVSGINRMTKCGTKQHASDVIWSKTQDTYDLQCDWDSVKKCSLAEVADVELNSRIYHEVPEEQKLFQPPEFDPANKSYRISTLTNNGVPVSNCSIENLCDAGFYLGEDGFIHCFRCRVRFSIEEFHPRDPHDPSWHGHSCNGLISRTQNDGRISDDARDPPGQQSIYIPSGDVRDERYRLSTFAKYPVSSAASKVNLARAGFYFTGYSDKVKCFSCGRTVERWEAADNPMDANWHKSSCLMQRGIACENIPIQSQFHVNSSAQSSNQLTYELQRNPTSGGSASYLRDVRGRPRSGASQAQQSLANVASSSQTPRQWKMANVISSDHRRYLTNLYLNRELDRLASFARWPTGHQTVSPESLAKAGFFYLGDVDRTQCFSCGGVLRNWTASDSPQVEHSHNFPQCQMVQGIETRNVPIPMRPEPREERERNFPCRHPTNPHMRSEATRLDTFDRRWPMGRTQATPDEIAHGGFFFLGERDRTKCWYCNGGLQNWEYDDAPWVEHAKWFPNCQFLLRMKGQHFVYRHLVANAHLQRPVIAKQEGSAIDQSSSGQAVATSTPRTQDVPPYESRNASQPAAAPTIIDPREEIRKRKELVQNAMRNSDIVKNIITMGFDQKIIEALLEDKVAAGTQANNEDIYDSMSELLNDVMSKEQEKKEEQEQMQRAAEAAAAQAGPSMFPSFSSTAPMTPYMTPPGSGKYNVYYDVDDDDDDAMNMYGSTQEATTTVRGSETVLPATSAIGSLRDTESLQEAMAKIEEESLCKICFSNKADMVFLPCSHMCCCMECTQAIRQCPLCRKPIERAIKTYVT